MQKQADKPMKHLLLISILITNMGCKTYMNNDTDLINEIKLVKNNLTFNYKHIPAFGKGKYYSNEDALYITLEDFNEKLPSIDEKKKKEISQLLNKIKYIGYSDTRNMIFVINYAYDFPAFYRHYMESIVFATDKKFLEQQRGAEQIEFIKLEENIYYIRNKISYFPYF